jgi:hypothetical protein
MKMMVFVLLCMFIASVTVLYMVAKFLLWIGEQITAQ